jgi:tRNA dimethylallyltransferase
VAHEVARQTGAVIVSVDSMQVYRGMDIGTGKPTLAERAEIPHEMIDVVDPAIDFTVPAFQSMAIEAMDALNVPVIVVGGSGLHFRSVVDPMTFAPRDDQIRRELEGIEPGEAVARLLGLDPVAADHVDMGNPRRVIRALEIVEITGEGPTERANRPEVVAIRDYVPARPFVGVGIDPDERLSDRIDTRVDEMISAGLAEETARLSAQMGRNASKALGYAEFIEARISGRALVDTIDAIKRNTLAFARRQRTWFRRDPRIEWLAPDIDTPSAVAYCLERWNL